MPERAAPAIVDVTDERGASLGTEDLMRAHRGTGRLHRAFSIFVFNARGQTLLQRRSPDKATFGRRWSNACCSHPRPSEDIGRAAERRLGEEMGFTVPLEEVARFTYRAVDPASGLVEHEYDHVLVGRFDGDPQPDPREASAWRWVAGNALVAELSRQPENFTPWLGPAIEALRGSGAKASRLL